VPRRTTPATSFVFNCERLVRGRAFPRPSRRCISRTFRCTNCDMQWCLHLMNKMVGCSQQERARCLYRVECCGQQFHVFDHRHHHNWHAVRRLVSRQRMVHFTFPCTPTRHSIFSTASNFCPTVVGFAVELVGQSSPVQLLSSSMFSASTCDEENITKCRRTTVRRIASTF